MKGKKEKETVGRGDGGSEGVVIGGGGGSVVAL